MPILCLKADEMLAELPPPVPVKFPIGSPVAETRSRATAGEGASRFGVWECSPGVWRRQVVQAEMCMILSGRALFEPDEGEPVSIEAGGAYYFPANSVGVWRIVETVRKTFVTFDEA